MLFVLFFNKKEKQLVGLITEMRWWKKNNYIFLR